MFCIYICLMLLTHFNISLIYLFTCRVVLAVMGAIVANQYHKGNGCGSSRKILLLVEMEGLE